MSLRRDRNCCISLCVILLALMSAGCGSGYSPDHAGSGTPAPDNSGLAYKDMSDTATTAMSLTTSGLRDPDTNDARIFALVKD